MLTMHSLQGKSSLGAVNFALVVNYLCAGFAPFVRSGFGKEYKLQFSQAVAPFFYEGKKRAVRLYQEYELAKGNNFISILNSADHEIYPAH